MGSYFHVIERKVGGNLDAFRRELGRLRESGHFHRDRHERIMRIAQTVGFGHIVRQCLVDTGHRAGCEVHVLTSTGIVLVFNAHSCKLVTVLVARSEQGGGGGAAPTGDAGLRRVRVPALGDARLLPEPERYTEGRGYLAIKGKD